jgi:type IV pilus assembly protein PilM
MKDSLRYSIEEALIDFESLGTIDKEDGSKVLSLLVASARRENVESKIAILKDAGLEVVSVSFAPFGFENIVKLLPPEDSSECTLIADIGHSGTEISIFENGRLEFVREAPVSSLEISEALTVTLAGEKGTISLDKDDAEKIKTEIGISYDADEPGAKVSPMQIMALIRPILETLAREIKRSAGYYSQQYGGGKVSRIYLAGGGGNLKNLDRFLQEGLGLLTQTIGMPPSITLLEKDAKKTCASALASVTGAVLGYSGRPNLLPYEYKLEKLEFIGTLSLRIAAFVFAAVLLTSFLFTKTQLSGYRQRLANIEFQRDFLRQVRELKERVDEREALLKRLQSTEIKGYIMMRELSRMMPPNMVLDWIKASIADRTVDIGGIIFGRPGVIEEVITKFMGEMERSKYFSEVQLTSVQHVDGQSEERSKFEINCIIE